MTDSLIDDVKTLLEKEKGDERILKQIYRACENNEVISNYERNYVRKLAEKYLGRIVEAEEKQHIEEKSISNKIFSDNQSKPNIEPPHAIHPQTIQLKRKNSKMLLGLGIAIFAVVVIIGISLSGVSYIDSNDSQIPVESSTLSIQTDLSAYQKGDIISISGTSSTTGKINLSIENQDGQLVWSEQIFVKNNGKFSTLAIAGGTGWDKSGTYTIKVENPQETKSKTFSFRA
jgi:hypothetical protein